MKKLYLLFLLAMTLSVQCSQESQPASTGSYFDQLHREDFNEYVENVFRYKGIGFQPSTHIINIDLVNQIINSKRFAYLGRQQFSSFMMKIAELHFVDVFEKLMQDSRFEKLNITRFLLVMKSLAESKLPDLFKKLMNDNRYKELDTHDFHSLVISLKKVGLTDLVNELEKDPRYNQKTLRYKEVVNRSYTNSLEKKLDNSEQTEQSEIDEIKQLLASSNSFDSKYSKLSLSDFADLMIKTADLLLVNDFEKLMSDYRYKQLNHDQFLLVLKNLVKNKLSDLFKKLENDSRFNKLSLKDFLSVLEESVAAENVEAIYYFLKYESVAGFFNTHYKALDRLVGIALSNVKNHAIVDILLYYRYLITHSLGEYRRRLVFAPKGTFPFCFSLYMSYLVKTNDIDSFKQEMLSDDYKKLDVGSFAIVIKAVAAEGLIDLFKELIKDPRYEQIDSASFGCILGYLAKNKQVELFKSLLEDSRRKISNLEDIAHQKIKKSGKNLFEYLQSLEGANTENYAGEENKKFKTTVTVVGNQVNGFFEMLKGVIQGGLYEIFEKMIEEPYYQSLTTYDVINLLITAIDTGNKYFVNFIFEKLYIPNNGLTISNFLKKQENYYYKDLVENTAKEKNDPLMIEKVDEELNKVNDNAYKVNASSVQIEFETQKSVKKLDDRKSNYVVDLDDLSSFQDKPVIQFSQPAQSTEPIQIGNVEEGNQVTQPTQSSFTVTKVFDRPAQQRLNQDLSAATSYIPPIYRQNMKQDNQVGHQLLPEKKSPVISKPKDPQEKLAEKIFLLANEAVNVGPRERLNPLIQSAEFKKVDEQIFFSIICHLAKLSYSDLIAELIKDPRYQNLNQSQFESFLSYATTCKVFIFKEIKDKDPRYASLSGAFFNHLFYSAIKNQNLELIEFLLKESTLIDFLKNNVHQQNLAKSAIKDDFTSDLADSIVEKFEKSLVKPPAQSNQSWTVSTTPHSQQRLQSNQELSVAAIPFVPGQNFQTQNMQNQVNAETFQESSTTVGRYVPPVNRQNIGQNNQAIGFSQPAQSGQSSDASTRFSALRSNQFSQPSAKSNQFAKGQAKRGKGGQYNQQNQFGQQTYSQNTQYYSPPAQSVGPLSNRPYDPNDLSRV